MLGYTGGNFGTTNIVRLNYNDGSLAWIKALPPVNDGYMQYVYCISV